MFKRCLRIPLANRIKNYSFCVSQISFRHRDVADAWARLAIIAIIVIIAIIAFIAIIAIISTIAIIAIVAIIVIIAIIAEDKTQSENAYLSASFDVACSASGTRTRIGDAAMAKRHLRHTKK